MVLPTADELMAAIPAGTTTYWLGPTYQGPAAVPGLVLSYAEWFGPGATLSYDRIDRRYAMAPALELLGPSCGAVEWLVHRSR